MNTSDKATIRNAFASASVRPNLFGHLPGIFQQLGLQAGYVGTPYSQTVTASFRGRPGVEMEIVRLAAAENDIKVREMDLGICRDEKVWTLSLQARKLADHIADWVVRNSATDETPAPRF